MTLKNIPMEVVESNTVAGVFSVVVVFNDDVSVAVSKKDYKQCV